MNYDAVQSTNISSIAYDDEQKILGVIFKNGNEYHYFDVPIDIYRELVNARSIGSYFNKNIRYSYKYAKM